METLKSILDVITTINNVVNLAQEVCEVVSKTVSEWGN